MAAGVSFLRVWEYGAVRWGLTVCEAPGCFAVAAVLCDADEWALRGVPLCLDCAGLMLERDAGWSIAVAAGLRLDEYPAVFEREELRPPARSGPAWWEHAERTPADFLREAGYYDDEGREDDGGEPAFKAAGDGERRPAGGS